MDAQTIFYTLGSVFMVLGIVVLIVIAVSLVYLVQAIKKLQEVIIERVDTIKSAVLEPSKIAKGVGSAAAGILAYGLKQMFNRRKG